MFRTRLFLGLLTAAALLLAWLILSDGLPYLRGPAPGTSEWYWPYLLRPADRWWAPAAAALCLFLAGGWWLSRPASRRRTTAGALLLLMAGNLLLQLGLIYADRAAAAAELVDRTLSNLSGGYFEAAAETEAMAELLRRYPASMPHFVSDHLRTHPPGLLLLNWSLVRLWASLESTGVTNTLARQVVPLRCADLWLLDRPLFVAAALATASLLPLLAAAAAVLPAYALARRLMPEPAARLATLLVATLPALLLFAPQSDQLFPVLLLALFYGIQRGLENRRQPWAQAGWWFAAGLVLSLLTFLSLGNAALLLPATLWLLLQEWQKRDGWERLPPTASHPVLFRWVVAFGTGTAIVWLVYWAGWGVPPWTVAEVSLQQHYQLVNQYRRYSWWLFFNMVDLVVYAGLPLVAGFTAAVIAAGRRWYHQPHDSDTGRKPVEPLPLLALSLAFFLLVLNLSGSTRAEVGRIWLFFMPLLALVSGSYLGGKLRGWRQGWLVLGLQLALLVAVGLAWQPVRAVIVVPQKPPQANVATPAVPVSARFGQNILLTGYDLDGSQASSGGVLQLTLHWQAEGPTTRPYTVFTHLVGRDGQLAAQQDNWPVRGEWPPTCWQRGEIVVDPYRIELPPNMPAGEYTLNVGLYDARDGSRLPLADGRDELALRTIIIQP
jgi:hypothetical protein